MIRTLILAIVLFLIGITIAINNTIKTHTAYRAIQDFTPCTVLRDSTLVYTTPQMFDRIPGHKKV